ncbi:MAG: DUF4912 domain-containing protein, partial [Vicinamibacteria bacterium]|nr:DUF4912 domain-containing protein [Vicinamibacteria bacterium]
MTSEKRERDVEGLLAEVSVALWDRPTTSRRLAETDLDEFQRVDTGRLLDACRLLKVKTTQADTDKRLAERVQGAIAKLVEPLVKSETVEPSEEQRVAGAKFEVGQIAEGAAPQTIPWVYGMDRVTGMAVNPETAFIYWEVSDEAIAHARKGLGDAGQDAWLALRLYDVTGLIFDGTNAHRYFDIKVDRSDRHWFVHVGCPSSTWCVEIGMKSYEGYFVRMARSGRVDFPRRAPAPAGAVEWLTVRSAVGELAPATLGPAIDVAPSGASAPGGEGHGREIVFGDSEQWRAFWRQLSQRLWAGRKEELRHEWSESGRTVAWIGPLVQTTWEAGPFAVPIEAPVMSEERFEGPVAIYSQEGVTRVVYGPWRVVIRGLGGWAERRILATWEVFTSWVVGAGFEKQFQEGLVNGHLGQGSEAVFAGASELRWLFGSELRLGGASEVFYLGASELGRMGASERLFWGASEWRLRGASEWMHSEASEWRLGGGSEQISGGASEWHLGGGS